MTLLQIRQEKIDEILQEQTALFDIDQSQLTTLEIDKAWGGLQYLLATINAGENGLSAAIISPNHLEEVEELVSDMYQVTYRSNQQVAVLAEALNGVTKEQLKKTFNPEIMNAQGIYPEGFDEEAWNYLLNYFEQVKAFYQQAKESQQAVLSYLI